jgi:hypothetical protein
MGLIHAIVSITKPRYGIKANLLVRLMNGPDTQFTCTRSKCINVKGVVIFIY